MVSAEVSILIPAYNEEKTLQNLLPTLLRYPGVSDVWVIDDGSTDRTADVATAAGAKVVRHAVRRGNGAAVKTGLRHVSQNTVLIMDADGQHTTDDVKKLLEVPSNVELAVGARAFRWFKFRDFGNLVLARIATWMTGAPVQDLTSGLRRIRKDLALQFCNLYPDGFSFPTTSTLLFLTSNYSVAFIAILNRSRPSHASPSKLRPFYEGVRFLSLIYRIIMLSYPLRFFAPLGIVIMLAGLGWTVRTLHLTAQVSAGGALMVLCGLTLLLFGTIADQLSQIRKTLARPSSN